MGNSCKTANPTLFKEWEKLVDKFYYCKYTGCCPGCQLLCQPNYHQCRRICCFLRPFNKHADFVVVEFPRWESCKFECAEPNCYLCSCRCLQCVAYGNQFGRRQHKNCYRICYGKCCHSCTSSKLYCKQNHNHCR